MPISGWAQTSSSMPEEFRIRWMAATTCGSGLQSSACGDMLPMLSLAPPRRESTKDYAESVQLDTRARPHAKSRYASCYDSPMDPVLARIQRVTEELNALEQDLNKIGTAAGNGPVPLLDEQASL